MTTTIPASVYRDAAEIINQRGWLQGAREEDRGGPVCIMGALAVALGLDPYACTEELMTAGQTVSLLLGIDTQMADWNDDPARTVEQVRAALLETADAMDAALVERGAL